MLSFPCQKVRFPKRWLGTESNRRFHVRVLVINDLPIRWVGVRRPHTRATSSTVVIFVVIASPEPNRQLVLTDLRPRRVQIVGSSAQATSQWQVGTPTVSALQVLRASANDGCGGGDLANTRFVAERLSWFHRPQGIRISPGGMTHIRNRPAIRMRVTQVFVIQSMLHRRTGVVMAATPELVTQS